VQQQEMWRLTASLEEKEPMDIQREIIREARENWLKVDRVLEERLASLVFVCFCLFVCLFVCLSLL
jgi:hypothetical protein